MTIASQSADLFASRILSSRVAERSIPSRVSIRWSRCQVRKSSQYNYNEHYQMLKTRKNCIILATYIVKYTAHNYIKN